MTFVLSALKTNRHRHESDHNCPSIDDDESDKHEKSEKVKQFIKDKLGSSVIKSMTPDASLSETLSSIPPPKTKKKLNPIVELIKMRANAVVNPKKMKFDSKLI